MSNPLYIKGAAIVLGIVCLVLAYFLKADTEIRVALVGVGISLFAWIKSAPGDVPAARVPTSNVDGSAGSE